MILDAGMTELIRPALYRLITKLKTSAIPRDRCFGTMWLVLSAKSSDCFGKAMQLPLTKRGDLIALRSAGAYGEVMSSNYNLREKVKAYYSGQL
ncbi:MAG: hypothetical protein U0Z17_08500 [Bacteroidales bacterium]